MPYSVLDTQDAEKARELAISAAPFGPEFTAEEVQDAARLQIVGSSFDDPGEDWAEFIVTKKDGTTLTRRIGGY